MRAGCVGGSGTENGYRHRGEVYLAISGAHIQSLNTRVSTAITSDNDEINAEHLQELHDMATSQPLPTDNAIVHHLLQHYVLDDGSTTDTRSASPASISPPISTRCMAWPLACRRRSGA